MLKTVYQRFVSLGRDEDGVAFVVTIAVFFFMYLMIAGVYAVGTAVKERVQLQNACDAAAYSAAVVQADTLSRIATLNRAMAWTYVSMTRRQMDYIVYKWLKETCQHHKDDQNEAVRFAWNGCPIHSSTPVGWGITDITLNNDGRKKYSRSHIQNCYESRFPNHMLGYSQSFYSNLPTLSGLGIQIDDDLRTIRDMGAANQRLSVTLPTKISSAVRDVLQANLSDFQRRELLYRVEQSANPLNETVGYLNALSNNANDEKRFVGFCDGSFRNYFENGGLFNDELIFGSGAGESEWFTRTGSDGIRRAFRYGCGLLKASWSWYATHWVCGTLHGIHWGYPDAWASASNCKHGHDNKCKCFTSLRQLSETCKIDKEIWRRGRFIGLQSSSFVTRRWIDSVCYADNNHSADDRYRGRVDNAFVGAKPLVLNQRYFGKAGAITVGLARKNENPWLSLLGRAGTVLGIYSAFNPFEGCSWSWAFASAKAGYKRLGEEYYDQGYPNRAYRIDWDSSNQSWNLCQSDWDAVMVPVRCAESDAQNGKWNIGNTEMLADYVGAQDQWRWLTQDDDQDNVVLGGWGDMIAGGQWQIGNPGVRLHWERLAERMFH